MENKRIQDRMITFQVQCRQLDTEGTDEDEKIVEGKVTPFDTPTVLWECDGIEYKEQIDSRAFDEAEMEDVIFNYNHGGKVLARMSNNTLKIEAKKDGLYMRATLKGTDEGRKLYEEIKGGYINKMSFRFSIKEESYDKKKHMWTVLKVKRLYDVSAVDIPAYEDTALEARKKSAEEQQSRIKHTTEFRKRKLKLKLETMRI